MAASAEPQPRLELDRAPTAVIGRLHRRMRHRLDHRLERYGLTGVQWTVLGHLGNEDGLSQAELQRRLAIEGATLTHIVQRLERDGFIRRSCDPEDRRRQRVWLSEKSRGLLPELAAIVAEHRAFVQRGLSADEVATLSSLLRRLEENLL
ncbi:MAG TPA: MarR family transcriptional regulator [Dehalococcoidia bacterium]|nr:MarR family transcriptional regulator [Dehalococcoidia bacterium]